MFTTLSTSALGMRASSTAHCVAIKRCSASELMTIEPTKCPASMRSQPQAGAAVLLSFCQAAGHQTNRLPA